MSKKLEYIRKAVFYSQQKPELLAELLAGVVTDVATSVSIEGSTFIKKPASGNATASYTAKVLSQYGDVMTGTPTLALKEAVTGVSISDGTVTVASTVTAKSFTIKATSGSLVGEYTVSIE